MKTSGSTRRNLLRQTRDVGLPTIFVFVLSCLAAPAAPAHHGIPGFDMTRMVVVEGTVTQTDWANPHVYFTVKTGGGSTSNLVEIEAASLPLMRANGLTKKQLAPGSYVKVLANPRRAGRAGHLLGRNVTLRDGSAYLLGSGQASARKLRAVFPADGIAGKWAAGPNAVPEWLAAEAQFPRVEGIAPRRDPNADRETPPPEAQFCYRELSVPWQYVYGTLQTIEITGSKVILRAAPYGYLNERTVHLDQKTHPREIAPSVLGHSIGHWEGRTLVVETTALMAPRARHIERFSLTEDRRQLRYEITIENPDLYTRPVIHSLLWDHRPDLGFEGDEGCDEEQARRFLQEDPPQKDPLPGRKSAWLPVIWIVLSTLGAGILVFGYRRYRRRAA